MQVTQVIFDTNAYRAITYKNTVSESIASIDKIRQKESLQNITAFASPIVRMELFCHLIDEKDEFFDNCHRALIGSYFHCLENENNYGCRLTGDGDDLLAGSLFDHFDPDIEKKYKGFDRSIYEIINNPNWKNEERYSGYFRKIKMAAEKDEINFLKSFKAIAATYAVRKEGMKEMLTVLRSEQLFNSIAEGQVFKALNMAKKNINELTPAEISKHTEFVKNYFPAPLYLSIYIMDKLISHPEFDITKKKRHNWVWDYQLLFYISKCKPNILVTDDVAMIEAAKAAGLQDKVMKLADYKSYLGF